MKVLVVGATGYTGQALVGALRSRGLDTVAHVRPDSPRLGEWQERFGALGAEVDSSEWTPVAMEALFARVAPDLVFAVLGTTKARQARSADPAANSYAAVDYGLTAMALAAAGTVEPRPRFVYLSSLGAESGTGAYMAARHRLEAELWASGVPFTIVRPAFITGPDRDERRWHETAGAVVGDALLGALAWMGGGGLAARYGSIDATALAAAMLAAAVDPAADGAVVQGTALRDYAARAV
ncbi:MAG: nucleoside-diphosphate-sugar epimerase [Myxococcota bacterium]